MELRVSRLRHPELARPPNRRVSGSIDSHGLYAVVLFSERKQTCLYISLRENLKASSLPTVRQARVK